MRLARDPIMAPGVSPPSHKVTRAPFPNEAIEEVKSSCESPEVTELVMQSQGWDPGPSLCYPHPYPKPSISLLL